MKRFTIGMVLPVYAISVMFVYGWTIYRFLWNFPSWIYYLTFHEILSVVAYSASINLIESLLLLAVPILFAFFLPRKWFFERFVPVGVLLETLLGLLLIYYAPYFQTETNFSYTPFFLAPVYFAVSITIAILLSTVKSISGFVADIADRAVVFLYLSVPLSIISIFIVLIRNLTM